MLPEESIIVEGLWDSPKALLASEAHKKRSVLLVTGGVREDSLFSNLSYFCEGAAVEFPAWETLPGEEIDPSPDIIGKRFEALDALIHRKKPSIVLCPLPSLLQKVIAKKDLAPLLHRWRKKSRIAFNSLPELLVGLGYRRSSVVSDKGEFAIRGGILDLFPVASSDPYRIEFFGDEIEEIRIFDPVGQKSIAKADEIFLCPAKETTLLQNKNLVNIFDYLDDPIIFWDDLLAIEDTYVKLKEMPGAKSPFFFKFEDLLKKWDKNQHIFCTQFHLENNFEMFDHKFKAKQFPHKFCKIEVVFDPSTSPDPNLEFLFLNANETEENEVKKQLSSITLPPKTRWEKGYLTSGYCLKNLVVVPNVEITKRSHVRRQKWRSTYHTPAAEFHELSPGDMVVHFHSGIGRFLGMEKHTNHLGQKTEFLTLQYADNSKLFVPLSQAYLVSRYIGSNEQPPTLSQLGGKRWTQTRANAQAQIVGYANDLLQLYAERTILGGFQYPPDSSLVSQFERDFPYAETQDQILAIDALKQDMLSDKPMDRLVCGDVGYGKTEVAMRAAFKAVADGQKQVAVLVPTTVLAVQHFETFSQRMSGFPIQVGVVSRFSSAKEMKETLQKVKQGEIDILIGTHRILSKDVKFKQLGLIIIDEEQRFGVKAKEHLKTLKANADCLTLSATPIPRTLYMSLVHARDMSVINTPPQDRLPVKSIIAETDPELIQNALMREFARGGQAYYIHNRVESIYTRAEHVQKLVPSAQIGIIHGQMNPDAVDKTIHRFKSGELNLLFATTIVENGIDISNANTILIDRADTYGLADLYQLRGRVGRWNRAAYAYFLIPKNASLSDTARKRLNALVEAGGYGGGMKVAMRDLEIRGAGDILGVQQSGQVSAIGFHLYCKMLKRAIDALKKKAPISFNETKMEFHFDAHLPEDYINEVSLRMEIYHRLGEALNFTEIDELLAEMQDRFGIPPEPVIWLYHLTRIRAFAASHHFSLLKFSNLSLLAEQQLGKELKKQTILLPKKVQKPKELEEYVIAQLMKNFSLTL
ncbi:MAG: transcription-repair coupling factor [Chlamydiae bacterium CG10_big_fil_rev_8_21_14_0_10_42_34]|nr:MAG: transcription-repair coupling factor [Chlamydiae bacterium CG10_big_fil_rev_8_21_14_0_10_42_34]